MWLLPILLCWIIKSLEGQLTPVDRDEILTKHNDYRGLQKVADMKELFWSEEFEKEAMKYLESLTTCPTAEEFRAVPDTLNRYNVLYKSDNTYTLQQSIRNAVENWAGQKSTYLNDVACESGTKNVNRRCHRFKRMMVGEDTSVGCAYKSCVRAKMKRNLVLCIYPSEIPSDDAFTQGDVCSRCPTEAVWCRNNLCFPCTDNVTCTNQTMCTDINYKKVCPKQCGTCSCQVLCDNCGQTEDTKCQCMCEKGYIGPFCTQRNLALEKSAYQPTTANGGTASKALDGIKKNVFSQGSCTHTVEMPSPFWYVDLVDFIRVNNVGIVNRADCCHERLSDFDIAVLEELPDPNNPVVTNASICHYQKEIFTGERNFKCSQQVTGRFLMIRLRKQDPGRILTLCEVEIEGNERVVPQNIIVKRNEKTAKLSSQYIEPGAQIMMWNHAPEAAVDLSKSGDMATTDSQGTCAYSKGGVDDPNPWWTAEFIGGKQRVNEVTIQNRVDCCAEYLNNFTIKIGTEICLEYKGSFTDKKTFTCDKAMEGDSISIYMNTTDKSLILCDVEILRSNLKMCENADKDCDGPSLKTLTGKTKSQCKQACLGTANCYSASYAVNRDCVLKAGYCGSAALVEKNGTVYMRKIPYDKTCDWYRPQQPEAAVCSVPAGPENGGSVPVAPIDNGGSVVPVAPIDNGGSVVPVAPIDNGGSVVPVAPMNNGGTVTDAPVIKPETEVLRIVIEPSTQEPATAAPPTDNGDTTTTTKKPCSLRCLNDGIVNKTECSCTCVVLWYGPTCAHKVKDAARGVMLTFTGNMKDWARIRSDLLTRVARIVNEYCKTKLEECCYQTDKKSSQTKTAYTARNFLRVATGFPITVDVGKRKINKVLITGIYNQDNNLCQGTEGRELSEAWIGERKSCNPGHYQAGDKCVWDAPVPQDVLLKSLQSKQDKLSEDLCCQAEVVAVAWPYVEGILSRPTKEYGSPDWQALWITCGVLAALPTAVALGIVAHQLRRYNLGKQRKLPWPPNYVARNQRVMPEGMSTRSGQPPKPRSRRPDSTSKTPVQNGTSKPSANGTTKPTANGTSNKNPQNIDKMTISNGKMHDNFLQSLKESQNVV